MCRFQCTCPPERRLFTVTPAAVKDNHRNSSDETFERNRNVNFFSPDSSDDENDFSSSAASFYNAYNNEMAVLSTSTVYPEEPPQHQVVSTVLDDIVPSSEDSGFSSDSNSDNGSSTGSLESAAANQPLKSILRTPSKPVELRDLDDKKRVSFADRWGQVLVQVREIPAREPIKWVADLVEIDEALFHGPYGTSSLLNRYHEPRFGAWLDAVTEEMPTKL